MVSIFDMGEVMHKDWFHLLFALTKRSMSLKRCTYSSNCAFTRMLPIALEQINTRCNLQTVVEVILLSFLIILCVEIIIAILCGTKLYLLSIRYVELRHYHINTVILINLWTNEDKIQWTMHRPAIPHLTRSTNHLEYLLVIRYKYNP